MLLFRVSFTSLEQIGASFWLRRSGSDGVGAVLVWLACGQEGPHNLSVRSLVEYD